MILSLLFIHYFHTQKKKQLNFTYNTYIYVNFIAFFYTQKLVKQCFLVAMLEKVYLPLLKNFSLSLNYCNNIKKYFYTIKKKLKIDNKPPRTFPFHCVLGM